jgi:DNA-binding NtrC family response regulator
MTEYAKTRPTIVQYAKTRLRVESGLSQGATFDVVNTTVRIGSAAESDFVLTDPSVSRRHCAIEPVPGGVRIRDEGSTNGVFLDDLRVYDALLGGPGKLRLGDTLIRVEPLAEQVDCEQAVATRFGELVGKSARMRELFALLARAAPTDATVLIEGETGTGKDLVAEAVHDQSLRADGPFVVFDCGAVAPTLAESELFGHEKGAFTGAANARAGVFERAHGGTLFLDELGELPKELQPKLLRALNNREIRRLGSERTIAADVRVVAATNRNLAAEVERGNFRADLYHRLSLIRVHVPPLRDRLEDVPVLVEHFLALAKPPRSPDVIPRALWDLFKSHRWPGNVRELANAVQRFLIVPERALDAPVEAPAQAVAGIQPLPVARSEANLRFEREYTQQAMALSGGNVTRAAELAGISRQRMQELVKRHTR